MTDKPVPNRVSPSPSPVRLNSGVNFWRVVGWVMMVGTIGMTSCQAFLMSGFVG